MTANRSHPSRSRIRLDRVGLAGFQSFGPEQTVELRHSITQIVGRNDVGKSAFLRALQLVHTPYQGVRSDFRLRCDWTVPTGDFIRLMSAPTPPPPWYEEFVQLHGNREMQGVSVTFASQDLDSSLLPTVSDTAIGTNITAHLPNLAVLEIRLTEGGMRVCAFRRPDGHPVLGVTEGLTLSEPFDMQAVAESVHFYLRVVLGLSGQTSYIGPRRVGAGPMTFQVERVLAPDASNLTNVIANLYVNEPTLFAIVQTFLVDAIPNIRAIRVPMEALPAAGGIPRTQAEIHIEYGARTVGLVPLQSCGTGIEQLLAIACGILTNGPGRIFLIDEPHAYLHPHAERSMLHFLQQHGQHQYIIASHSGVLMNAVGLAATRLFSIDREGTRIPELGSVAAVLEELGVKPSDLWAHDNVAWVEGPTEEAVCRLIIDNDSDLTAASVTIKRMPDTSRFGAASSRTARATFEFVRRVREAITPLPVHMMFLFDSDEKTTELKQEIDAASGGTSAFLDVREIENYLLSAAGIHAALCERAEDLELPKPSLGEIERSLQSYVNRTTDEHLYRQRRLPIKPSAALVAGAEVLRRMYWEWVKCEYDKVRDGTRLAELILKLEPDRLRPLRNLLFDRLVRPAQNRMERSRGSWPGQRGNAGGNRTASRDR